jgi:serine/threonine-protein kinase
MISASPQNIGKYRIERLLGSGGMGKVFLGIDPDIGRQVAIKIVSLDSGTDARERFLREARTMGRLNHPNIVTLLEFGVEGDTPYLVLEYLGGHDLSEWIREPHTLADYLRVMRAVAMAISAAHLGGVLHRDIKPENVRVLDDGRCKLLDFGIADGYEEGHLTASGAFVGTTDYVAPEVIAGQRHTEQSDIYALGVLFYSMLAGNNPFRGDTVAATLARVLQYLPPSLRSVRAGIPEPLVKLVTQCLDKDPARRPAKATDLVEALDASLALVDDRTALAPLKKNTATTPAHLSPRATRLTATQALTLGSRTGVGLMLASVLGIGLIGYALWMANHPARVAETGSPITASAPTDRAALTTATPTQPTTSPLLPDAETTPPNDRLSVEDMRHATVSSNPLESSAADNTDPAPQAHKPPTTAAVVAKPADPTKTKPASAASTTAAKPTPVVTRAPPVVVPDPRTTAAANPAQSVTAPMPSTPQKMPTATSPLALSTPPLSAAPVAPLPRIESISARLLHRGRPLILQIKGQHFTGVTGVKVLLGSSADDRFQISELQVIDDYSLSVRIETPRNAPLGMYALRLESTSGVSPPWNLEVSL